MDGMFRRWLIGDLGTAGVYDFTAIHYWTVAVVAAVFLAFLALALALRGKPRAQRAVLVSVAIFHLIFEVAWRLIYLFVKGDDLSCWWPTYPCNLGGILLPIMALTNCRAGKKLFYLFGFVGGVLTFAISDGIFSSNVLVFPILKSILQHTGLLLIPMLALAPLPGISVNIIILAFLFGDGYTNVLYPTCATLVVGLGLAEVNYVDWLKKTGWFQVVLFLLSVAFLLLAVYIGL